MRDNSTTKRLEIQGHRGARGLWPENTLPGFAATLGLGVDTLELDVGISSDGVLVVHHDSTLNPMTTRGPDGKWIPATDPPPLYSLSVSQLQSYDVGMLKPNSSYANRYPQQRSIPIARIPTLMQVIELLRRCDDEHVRLNIEAKLEPEKPALTAPPERFAASLVEILHTTRMTSRATIQSFDWRVQAHARTLDERIPTAYLSEQRIDMNTVAGHGDKPSPWTNGMHLDDYHGCVPRMVKAAGGAVWSPDFQSLGEEALREAHALGLRVVVWTVNSVDDIKRMISLGVDGVISDYPDRVREVARSFGLPLPTATQAES